MSLLGKLMDTMRLNPDEEEDDYYLDDDFEVAIEEGATMVRVGTSIFGAR